MYVTLNKQIKNTNLLSYFLNAKTIRKDVISFFCISLVSNVFTFFVVYWFKTNSTMCFLFSVSCCLCLLLLTKKARDKQRQKTGNKEHIVELALR